MRQAPERVAKLALLDTGARGRHAGTDRTAAWPHGARQSGRYAEIPDLAFPLYVHRDRQGDEALKASCSHMAEETGLDAYLRQQQAIIGRPDSRPGLAAITCPTLVLVGEGDEATPPELAREIAAGIAGSRLVIIPDSGHLSTLEQPKPSPRPWSNGCGRERSRRRATSCANLACNPRVLALGGRNTLRLLEEASDAFGHLTRRSILSALARSGLAAAALVAGARPERLSEPADPPDRRLCRRRRQRYFRPPGRAPSFRNPRPGGGGREPARRRRTAVRRICLQPAGRRLHAPGRRDRRDVDRGRDLSRSQIPSDQNAHAAGDDRELPADLRDRERQSVE